MYVLKSAVRIVGRATVMALLVSVAVCGFTGTRRVFLAGDDAKPKPVTVEPDKIKKLEWSNFMLQVQTYQTQARAAYAEAQLAEKRAVEARLEADKVFAAMQNAAGPDYEPDADHLQKTGDLRFKLKDKKETPKDAKP